MRLRSIPPANRQHRSHERVSVGSQSVRPTPIHRGPDPAVRQQQNCIRDSICKMAESIEQQIATAIEPQELVFWKAALARLKRG